MTLRNLVIALVAILVTLVAFPRRGSSEIGPNSVIPPIRIFPDLAYVLPEFLYSVYIEDTQGQPLEEAEVELRFPEEACDLLVLCDELFTDCPASYTATTDPSGIASFSICGGGCWDETILAEGYLVEVYVNSLLEARVGVRSTSIEDPTTKKSWELWCNSPPNAAGTAKSSLADAVFFTPPYGKGKYEVCADINGDEAVSLADALAVTKSIKHSTICQELPN